MSAAEVALLIENTERLVSRLQSQYLLGCLEGDAKEGTARRSAKRRVSFSDPLAEVDFALVAAAKRRVAAKHGVDPDLPGWRSYVIEEAKAILRENAA